MKQDLYKKYHNEVFEYEAPKDDITPGFILGVVLTIIVMIAIISLFAMVVASGVVFIGSQL